MHLKTRSKEICLWGVLLALLFQWRLPSVMLCSISPAQVVLWSLLFEAPKSVLRLRKYILTIGLGSLCAASNCNVVQHFSCLSCSMIIVVWGTKICIEVEEVHFDDRIRKSMRYFQLYCNVMQHFSCSSSVIIVVWGTKICIEIDEVHFEDLIRKSVRYCNVMQHFSGSSCFKAPKSVLRLRNYIWGSD